MRSLYPGCGERLPDHGYPCERDPRHSERDPRHSERRELDTDRVEIDDGDVGELVDSTVTVNVREGLSSE